VIIAVLGDGVGGDTTAADLALAGHRVRLWRASGADLASLGTPPTLTLAGEGRQGAARLESAGSDIGKAVEGADVVIVALPAPRHADVATSLGPHLSERQIVLLAPGLLGSLAMARSITRAGGTMPHAFAESATLPYLAHGTGAAALGAPVRVAHLPVGVFPASHTTRALESIGALYPVARPCADALDAALDNAGPVLHPAVVLLNLGAVDGGRVDVHAAATAPSVRRVIEAVDGERVATRRGWAYAPPDYEVATYYDEARAEQGLHGRDARTRLLASELGSEPITLEHAYVAEDAAFGLSLLESAARTVGVPTPATSGLLSLFGVLLGRELSGAGRALDHLGLGDLTRREIRGLLAEGWRSPLWSRVTR
jgi:opine dehydrogenase